ncbi:MAG: hypothetical protein BZY87_02290 [SAR202 cluster bacterium Io17-Chloro-G6]|nr:MAG: hypothetical protein BZY87_02290 [SAR202 cluster bacterium Io17-Chloro-G6]
MITAFHTVDALRCMLVNAPGEANLAAPTESVVRCRPLSNFEFWRQSLTRNPNRVTVGDWNGMGLSSLASARVRGGVRAWEVDRLHLNAAEQALDLLEQVVETAGIRGAERVFLRLPSDSSLVDEARRAGFFPFYDEIHLTGQEWTASSSDVAGVADSEQSGRLGRFTAEDRAEPDSHGLFQLYCAATPQQVRVGVGMTFDQWHDSQEQPQPRKNETVIKLEGKIVGWRLRDPFGDTAAGQVLAHPGQPDMMRHLIDSSHNTPHWLVPSYQENTAEQLTRSGLSEAGRYTMLIKTVTVPVISRELSYVEA